MQAPGFIPALRNAVEDYRRFVGAQSVTWPRSNPGRRLAGELRRLQP
jgi:hypothetical protein